ncbi:MAG TPA: metallophosphoesterase [Candidatus Acidoferrum sp.]|nr:metallophosphoesterase [Candidatus Acidoferrum sp.]
MTVKLFRLLSRVFRKIHLVGVLLLVLPTGAAPPPPSSAPLLVAIGDVHGDFDDFCSILQRVGLIDEQRHWAGGNATLLQLGDLIDRGPKPREVLDLILSLDEQSAKAGGHVVALLGNHEMMNLMGDLRYVTVGNYASFVDSESENRRQTAFQKYLEWRKAHPQLLAELNQPVLPETEAEWMTRHPPGFIEHRAAFGPSGIYGKWLRQRLALIKIGGVIFLHGGINPDLTSVGLDEINNRIRGELNQYDEARQYLADENVFLPFFTLQEAVAVAQAELIAERKQGVKSNDTRQARIEQFLALGGWLSVREDGPLWYRGYDQWSEEEGAPKVEKILAAYNATNLVVAHTVQKTARIRLGFGGRILFIDTGMLSSYYHGGKPSALEINEDGKFTAVYLDQQVALPVPKSAQSTLK